MSKGTAIIIGVGPGLGLALARTFAGADHPVALIARDTTQLSGYIGELQAAGHTARAYEADAGKADTLTGAITTAATELGAPDVLIYNASVLLPDTPTELNADDFTKRLAVNVVGAKVATDTVLPLLKDGGRIVNISSGLARFTNPGSSAYGSMKGAVEVLTRYLAKELGPRGIAVNTVAPGAIATDFSGGLVRDNPEVNRRMAEMTALGRAGQPDDIGPMIAALLSDDNRWINGQRIEVSGGMAL